MNAKDELERLIDEIDGIKSPSLERRVDWTHRLRAIAASLPESQGAVATTRDAWREWGDRTLTDGNGWVASDTIRACFDAFLLASGEHADEGMRACVHAGLLAAHHTLFKRYPPRTGREKDSVEISLAEIERIAKNYPVDHQPLYTHPSPPPEIYGDPDPETLTSTALGGTTK